MMRVLTSDTLWPYSSASEPPLHTFLGSADLQPFLVFLAQPYRILPAMLVEYECLDATGASLEFWGTLERNGVCLVCQGEIEDSVGFCRLYVQSRPVSLD